MLSASAGASAPPALRYWRFWFLGQIRTYTISNLQSHLTPLFPGSWAFGLGLELYRLLFLGHCWLADGRSWDSSASISASANLPYIYIHTHTYIYISKLVLCLRRTLTVLYKYFICLVHSVHSINTS